MPAGAVRRHGQELTVTVQDSVTVELLENTVLTNLGGQAILLRHVAEIDRLPLVERSDVPRVGREVLARALDDRRPLRR